MRRKFAEVNTYSFGCIGLVALMYFRPTHPIAPHLFVCFCVQASDWYSVMLALLRAMDLANSVVFLHAAAKAPFMLSTVLALYFPIVRRWAFQLAASSGK